MGDKINILEVNHEWEGLLIQYENGLQSHTGVLERFIYSHTLVDKEFCDKYLYTKYREYYKVSGVYLSQGLTAEDARRETIKIVGGNWVNHRTSVLNRLIIKLPHAEYITLEIQKNSTATVEAIKL